MLADPFLLDKIVGEAILDLRAGRNLRDVTDWAIDAYVTKYRKGQKIASDLEIREEFMKALVAEIIEREQSRAEPPSRIM